MRPARRRWQVVLSDGQGGPELPMSEHWTHRAAMRRCVMHMQTSRHLSGICWSVRRAQ